MKGGIITTTLVVSKHSHGELPPRVYQLVVTQKVQCFSLWLVLKNESIVIMCKLISK